MTSHPEHRSAVWWAVVGPLLARYAVAMDKPVADPSTLSGSLPASLPAGLPASLIARLPTLYLARHAETVFNATRRMQGWMSHTPLTHRGITQAHRMGEALRDHFGPRPALELWMSTAGRAQQTAAVIAEHLEIDFFSGTADERLQEIHVGDWQGRSYADVIASHGAPIVDAAARLFSVRPPGGEWYPDIAARLTSWLEEVAGRPGPLLVISHGISSRILRGLVVGGPRHQHDWPQIADDLPQGTVVRIDAGEQSIIHLGDGDDGNHRLY